LLDIREMGLTMMMIEKSSCSQQLIRK
jgi:hypothetical protein